MRYIKFFLVFILTISTVFIFSGCSKPKEIPQVISNGNTYIYNEKAYNVYPFLDPEKIDEKIAKTKDGVEIFKIKDQSSQKWLAGRYPGADNYFTLKEESVPSISIEDFKANEIKIASDRNDDADKNILNSIVKILTTQIPVKLPDAVKFNNQIWLYSSKYPNLKHVMNYFEDNKGEYYILDTSDDGLTTQAYKVKDLFNSVN